MSTVNQNRTSDLAGPEFESRHLHMEEWFTSDLHLGHARIVELCNRPFADVEEMNKAIIDRWNAKVGKDDRVYVLGDVALGKIRESLALINELNGHLYLIPGNHDRCWSGHRKVRIADYRLYEDVGFAILAEDVTHLLGWRMSHMPYDGDSHDSDRYKPHRPVRGEETWLLHGHVHNAWKVNGYQINVGVDVWDFAPVNSDQILELTKTAPPVLLS